MGQMRLGFPATDNPVSQDLGEDDVGLPCAGGELHGKTTNVRSVSLRSEVNMETQRPVMAFLFAPLVVPLVFLVPVPGVDNSGEHSLWKLLSAIVVMAIYALPLAYLGELLLGLPAWLIFKH
jgi:hypothetical protein